MHAGSSVPQRSASLTLGKNGEKFSASSQRDDHPNFGIAESIPNDSVIDITNKQLWRHHSS